MNPSDKRLKGLSFQKESLTVCSKRIFCKLPFRQKFEGQFVLFSRNAPGGRMFFRQCPEPYSIPRFPAVRRTPDAHPFGWIDHALLKEKLQRPRFRNAHKGAADPAVTERIAKCTQNHSLMMRHVAAHYLGLIPRLVIRCLKQAMTVTPAHLPHALQILCCGLRRN